MNRRDPLERAFELLKADSTGLADNPNLENKLMNELRRQNRPSRFKKVALVLAVLVGLVLAGGGIAMAAGFNPIEFFVNKPLSEVEAGTYGLSDGSTEIYYFAPTDSATVIMSKQPDKNAKPIPPAPIGQKK